MGKLEINSQEVHFLDRGIIYTATRDAKRIEIQPINELCIDVVTVQSSYRKKRPLNIALTESHKIYAWGNLNEFGFKELIKPQLIEELSNLNIVRLISSHDVFYFLTQKGEAYKFHSNKEDPTCYWKISDDNLVLKDIAVAGSCLIGLTECGKIEYWEGGCQRGLLGSFEFSLPANESIISIDANGNTLAFLTEHGRVFAKSFTCWAGSVEEFDKFSQVFFPHNTLIKSVALGNNALYALDTFNKLYASTLTQTVEVIRFKAAVSVGDEIFLLGKDDFNLSFLAWDYNNQRKFIEKEFSPVQKNLIRTCLRSIFEQPAMRIDYKNKQLKFADVSIHTFFGSSSSSDQVEVCESSHRLK